MGKKRLWKGIVLALVLCMALGLVSCGTKKESKKENNLVVEATSWIAKNDGSNLVFETEKDYVWYEKKDVTEDNYFRGSYRFYMGEAALRVITEDLPEYAVTKKEILDTIKNSDRYSLENLVCLRVENHSFMLEGKEQLKEVTPGAYFGFLLDKGNLLSIVNMNTATQYEFTKGK